MFLSNARVAFTGSCSRLHALSDDLISKQLRGLWKLFWRGTACGLPIPHQLPQQEQPPSQMPSSTTVAFPALAMTISSGSPAAAGIVSPLPSQPHAQPQSRIPQTQHIASHRRDPGLRAPWRGTLERRAPSLLAPTSLGLATRRIPFESPVTGLVRLDHHIATAHTTATAVAGESSDFVADAVHAMLPKAALTSTEVAAAAVVATAAAAAVSVAASSATTHHLETTDVSCQSRVSAVMKTDQPSSSSASRQAPEPCEVLWCLQNQQPASPSPGAQARKAPATAKEKGIAPAGITMEEGSAFAVYDAKGSPCSFDALLACLDSYDVVLLGEYHDDPVAHQLQLRLLRHVLGLMPHTQQDDSSGSNSNRSVPSSSRPDTYGTVSRIQEGLPPSPPQQERQQQLSAGVWGCRRPVALSLEMFERDVQGVMDEYLAGLVTEADMMKDARPWPNYFSDYRPMVLAAKEAGATVVCANAPRRYVSLVGRHGSAMLSSLPTSSFRHLGPLPLRPASDQYIAKIRWTMQRVREPAPEGTARDQDQQEEEIAAPLNGTSPATAAATAAAVPGGGGSEAANLPQPSSTGSPATTATASDGNGDGGGRGKECPHIGLTLRSNFVEAQNLWDAVMADSIARALRQLGAAAGEGSCSGGGGGGSAATAIAVGGGSGGGAVEGAAGGGRRPLVVHICGKFHSEQRLGICEHLAAAAPAATVCVITFVPSSRGVTVPSATLTAAGLHTYGDWLVLTNGKLPRSFDSEHPV